MYSNSRDHLRQVFFSAWRKYQEKAVIEPLEQQLIDIILLHPEYQDILNHPTDYLSQDFTKENPFLHMSLHLAIQEQCSTDRPAGIKQIYQQLCLQHPAHEAMHHLMDCLAQSLWQAQQMGGLPDEDKYLSQLKSLV